MSERYTPELQLMPEAQLKPIKQVMLMDRGAHVFEAQNGPAALEADGSIEAHDDPAFDPERALQFGGAIMAGMGSEAFTIPTMKATAEAEGLELDFTQPPVEAVDRYDSVQ